MDEVTQPERRYDVVVVGAGPAGENVADRVVRGGLSCLVVEAELVGGECSYWACMPSKALLRPLELAAAARRVPGVPTGRPDPAAVFARRDAFTSHHDDAGQVAWVRGLPADLVRGTGRLTGVRQVTVDRSAGGPVTVHADRAVVLATGTAATLPPVDGLAAAGVWTSREATSASAVPDRLAVIGGGVVACELAQAYAGLGSAVTMLVRGGGVLSRFEPFAGKLVAGALADAGVLLRTGSRALRADRSASGEVTLTLATDGPVPGGGDASTGGDTRGGETLVCDEVLVATGRRPRTSGLGLAALGLPDGGYLPVDDTLRVPGVEGGWLYAVGDVNGRNLLTHMGKYQARICGDAIVARARGANGERPAPGSPAPVAAVADGLGAPQVIFTDPQVAAVGRTEAQARATGVEVDVVEIGFDAVAGAALHADGYRGGAKLVIDRAARVLLGATFVGQDVAELVHAATVAVVGRVTVDQLWHAVPAYPTLSEVWLRLLEAYRG